jgi:hypothetical protein
MGDDCTAQLAMISGIIVYNSMTPRLVRRSIIACQDNLDTSVWYKFSYVTTRPP